MCKNFHEIWQKRLSKKEDDQIALYHCVICLANRAKNVTLIPYDERESLVSDFYTYKIFNVIEKATFEKKINPSYIVQMMNNYIIDYLRKTTTETGPIDPQFNTSVDNLLDDATIHNDEEHLSNIPPFMIDHAKAFLETSKPWVKTIMIYHYHGGRLDGVKCTRYRCIQLGIKRQKTQCWQTYHKDTLIGKWLVLTYGRNILPLDKDFLRIIFISFQLATFTYREADV